MIEGLLRGFAKFRREHALGWLIVPLGVMLLVTLVSMYAVDEIPFLKDTDLFVQDSQIARQPYGVPQDPDIVIAAITEDTLQQFPYRSPVDRGFVSDLLQSLAAKGARVVGVDLLFDQATEAQKDDALRHTLRTLKVPLVVSYADSPAVEAKYQLDYLDAFVPPAQRAFANIGTDQYDMTRWILPGATAHDGHYMMSFARAVAAKAGVTTPVEQIPIVWHGSPEHNVTPFKEYAAHLVPFLPAPWFKGKIVLIGTDMTLVDRHRTPISRVQSGGDATTAGVVIQAHALSQLLHATPSPLLSWRANFMVALAFALIGAMLGTFTFPLLWRAGALVGLIAVLWFAGQDLLYHVHFMIGLIAPSLAAAGSFAAMESVTGSEARYQRESIRDTFSLYVSPKLVEQLVKNPERAHLEGERRLMTYLFTDVKDFTSMSERLDSRELARVLNEYLEGITAIVLKYDGMVDKFIGDAVFAIFNAPVDLPDHADHAVGAALEIDRFCQNFHEAQNRRGVPFGITRIGVHTGSAVIGNFGSSKRRSYTAQGDAVNTASRLEALNKHFGTRICVSEATRALCRTIRFRPIASVVLKGKTEAVGVFEPLRQDDGREGYLQRYHTAFDRMQNKAPDALALFAALTQEAPDDPCVALHVGRLSRGDMGASLVMTEK